MSGIVLKIVSVKLKEGIIVRKYTLFLVIFFSILVFESSVISYAQSSEPLLVTYRAPESKRDLRYNYDNALLKLALESTMETDGPYRLIPSPVMNFSRARHALEFNKYPNFFIKLSYEDGFGEGGLAFVPFPVDLGIVGYRICFVSPESKELVAAVTELDELKKFVHGQGKSWSDTTILRENGFRVVEIAKYESLFSMVSKGRFDLFCRGVNELLDEVEGHRHIPNLQYDSSMAIVYPLPRFFYTNKKNKRALDRVQRGIMIAYENGSLQELWRQEYQANIDFVELEKRKIFTLENPLLRSLSFDYQQYFYDPFDVSN